MSLSWLDVAKRLQAIAQSGLAYVKDPYDAERYEQIRDLAVEMMASASTEAPDVIRGLFASEDGYATPKVDVRGAVFRNERILLVRERQDGLWTLPGGWADVGASPSQAVVREVREESGFQVRPVRLMACLDRSRHAHPPCPYHIYKLFFLCEIVGGEACAGLETLEAGFFDANDLPPLSVSRTLPEQIRRLFQLFRDPGLTPDFD